MNRCVVLAAAMALAANAWSATYTYNGNNYTATTDYSSCVAGVTCANFSTSMKVTGSFTTAAPLAANLVMQNIVSQLTSYSFSNGVTVFNNTDPNARIKLFAISTDASGRISDYMIELDVWQTARPSHQNGDRLAVVLIDARNQFTFGFNNHVCDVVSTSAMLGEVDACMFLHGDSAASTGQVFTLGSWTVSNLTPVPTLGEWGMIGLAVLLVLYGYTQLRGRSEMRGRA